MDLAKALALYLGSLTEAAITPYKLGVGIHALYLTKEYKGQPVARIQKEFATVSEYNLLLRRLLDAGILKPLSGSQVHAFVVLGKSEDSVEEILCSIDPFCYISHLSAMAYHGLTDRIPSKIFVSSPSASSWKDFAQERMRKDLGGYFTTYVDNGMPTLRRPILSKVGRQEIHQFASSHLGAFKHVPDRTLRVSTIGRTFLDMLRSPELCGGMRHVLQVYDEHAKMFLQPIIDEINRHGVPIDKVRAGYLLEEKLGVQDPIVDSWVQFASRGGSRKLDSSLEYVPVWSEKWCLSINI